jgi:hypothetical protein
MHVLVYMHGGRKTPQRRVHLSIYLSVCLSVCLSISGIVHRPGSASLLQRETLSLSLSLGEGSASPRKHPREGIIFLKARSPPRAHQPSTTHRACRHSTIYIFKNGYTPTHPPTHPPTHTCVKGRYAVAPLQFIERNTPKQVVYPKTRRAYRPKTRIAYPLYDAISCRGRQHIAPLQLTSPKTDVYVYLCFAL